MKYALVTGATKGIGYKIAVKMLEEGYFVFINYAHDDESANLLSKELKIKFQEKFSLLKADLSEPESIDLIVKELTKQTNRIDVLVLNAGITDYSNFADITWDAWMKVLNTNLNVPFFLIQNLSPYINVNGSIVVIGSVLGRIPHATSLAYGVTKAALQFLAKELVKIFAEKRVRVNAVCPGFTNTLWQETKTPERKKRIESKIALRRFAEPEEIADMCLAVIHNTYINGSIIDINGGYSFE